MAKAKRTRPFLDMTPMVDLAFLLVTFFMLTTKFSPQEPVVVDMPSSTAEIKLPDSDIITISIGNDGRIFFNIDNKYNREELIRAIDEMYGLSLNEEQIHKFSIMSGFGIPISGMSTYLKEGEEVFTAESQPGIPCTDAANELSVWIRQSRMVNPKLRIAIKGDRNVEYTVFKKVLKTLQDNNINRFNMITNLEQAS